MRRPFRLFGPLLMSIGALSCQPQASPPILPSAAPLRVAPSPLPAPSPTPLPILSPPPVPGARAEAPYPMPSPPTVGPLEAAGMVVDRGRPASGIPLTVMNRLNGRTYKVTTDAQGTFRVQNLPEGEYYTHFYNDSHNDQVGFWRTRDLKVTPQYGAAFPTWDVHLIGMQNRPAQGASVRIPFTAEFEPYPLAVTYRFRVHDRGGPSGQALYVSERVPAKGVRSFTFDGTTNQPGTSGLGPGRYLWGYQWDAGALGEGGCLFQDFVVSGRAPSPSRDTSLLGFDLD